MQDRPVPLEPEGGEHAALRRCRACPRMETSYPHGSRRPHGRTVRCRRADPGRRPCRGGARSPRPVWRLASLVEPPVNRDTYSRLPPDTVRHLASSRSAHRVVREEPDERNDREREHLVEPGGPDRGRHRQQQVEPGTRRSSRSDRGRSPGIPGRTTPGCGGLRQNRRKSRIIRHIPGLATFDGCEAPPPRVLNSKPRYRPTRRTTYRSFRSGRRGIEQPNEVRVVRLVVDDEPRVNGDRTALVLDLHGVGVAAEVIIGLVEGDVVHAIQAHAAPSPAIPRR